MWLESLLVKGMQTFAAELLMPLLIITNHIWHFKHLEWAEIKHSLLFSYTYNLIFLDNSGQQQ